MNINDVLKNFNSSDLQQINEFLNSAQGKKMAANLGEKEKENILRQFMQLDPNKIKSKLNGLSKEDILKLLK